mmetsp:Transcript_82721/g.221827  ORF Transcript_82721/g.221827 Transcript_82721/m.221827 type:complete len:83 (+) Transcript_82721:147-395(+)
MWRADAPQRVDVAVQRSDCKKRPQRSCANKGKSCSIASGEGGEGVCVGGGLKAQGNGKPECRGSASERKGNCMAVVRGEGGR